MDAKFIFMKPNYYHYYQQTMANHASMRFGFLEITLHLDYVRIIFMHHDFITEADGSLSRISVLCIHFHLWCPKLDVMNNDVPKRTFTNCPDIDLVFWGQIRSASYLIITVSLNWCLSAVICFAECLMDQKS